MGQPPNGQGFLPGNPPGRALWCKYTRPVRIQAAKNFRKNKVTVEFSFPPVAKMKKLPARQGFDKLNDRRAGGNGFPSQT
jgi:hypothetical protein